MGLGGKKREMSKRKYWKRGETSVAKMHVARQCWSRGQWVVVVEKRD